MTKSTVPLLTEADAALRRFGELWRRGRDGSVEPGLLEEVMEELSVALHELQTSADELREQQEQLLRAEARIAEERRRYHELFEFGPDGYLVTTGTAVIRESNRMAATLLGVPTSSLFSKPLSVFVHIDRRIAFRTLLNTMAAGEMTTQTLETVIVRRGGATFPAVLRVIAARSPRTCTVELRWTLRDVTGERAVQRDLLAQMKTVNASRSRCAFPSSATGTWSSMRPTWSMSWIARAASSSATTWRRSACSGMRRASSSVAV